ncbi:MAG: Photosystem I reaction center subunit III [Pseudanabaena sp.]|jgi:photosystem I subunit 3|nr:Photosystem I reaction center subunit III [Chitinophagaceae bacterium]MCA6504575.1 Photosystem I reaction center subunit III [Pseudanabaena sp. M090S1SP2A07QC]MCA6506701.1 Photosystem I reaction center subunit III [Pseudanabaena sp. M172S2SP2A07QC]MCA6509122.1 Photosystem I reaction center subunit III [Pseudanabaena sp. M109S1SP2A07QC]MCA6518268.1 Photosystem I reaction center subunit III [Pseudanabaena sp. M110S1SP2A07QC]MCA6524017.1 Photosystem I reaction center subunit III [Pseudanabaena
MKRLFALILVISLWFGVSLAATPAAYAEFSFNALTPCATSSAFQDRLQTEVDGYTARLANFKAGSGPAEYLKGKVAQTEARFAKYANSGLLCGEDGLPHLISDGRWSHAGEFTIPALMFLFITGWIGWVGRAYLIAIRKDPATATQKEIIIDLPLAIKCMLTGFAWPLAALKEFGTGELLAPENEVTVSPR